MKASPRHPESTGHSLLDLDDNPSPPAAWGREVRIPVNRFALAGDLAVPSGARGLVLFAHGSGSSRLSPRNQAVALALREAGIATLLFDLLTPEEEREDSFGGPLRFNIELLASRLVQATRWVRTQPDTRRLGTAYFGSSTGAAAALVAAAELGPLVQAVVSRGGRPDLADDALPRVLAPTLLVVGGLDHDVLALNKSALARLTCPKHLAVIPGATHLFEEPGTLEQAATLAADWFLPRLRPISQRPSEPRHVSAFS